MKDNVRFVTKGLSGLNPFRADMHTETCKGYSKTWFVLMLLVVFLTGCNGNNESLGGGGGTTAPTVSSTVPADGATGVAIDANITATFSTAMDPLTITTTTFTVTDGTTDIAGTVALSADGLTATFTPTSDFAADTTFTATITTGAKDLNGKALAVDKVWSFTTGSTLSPTVSSTFPADAATDVAVTTTITATFSNDMASATITPTTFTLTTGVANIPGAVTYDAATKTAFLNPTSDLAAGTSYTARITTGVRDVNGNPMKENKVWNFTTI